MIAEKDFNDDFIANGFSASVRKINLQEKRYFPTMEVCRVENSPSPEYPKMLYYSHKIAFLLFPNHFINVGAAVQYSYLHPSSLGKSLLYSRLIEDVSDHAIFSSHMQPATNDAFGFGTGKESSCLCETCKKHRQIHRSSRYNLALWQL